MPGLPAHDGIADGLDPAEQNMVTGRPESLRGRIDAGLQAWRRPPRNQVGDKVCWYAEPEQGHPGGG